MKKLHLRRRAGTVACATMLAAAATAIGLSPAAAAAPGAESCGSRTITVRTKGTGKQLNVPVSRIRVEGGATCAEAYTVIRGVLLHRLPAGWTVVAGNFKVPHGLHAEVATKGRKKVKFALVGS